MSDEPDHLLLSTTVGRIHGLVLAAWALIGLLVVVSIALVIGVGWPPDAVGIVMVSLLLVLYLLVAPWRALPAGLIPRRFEGTTLVGRRLTGAERRIHLEQVTAAGFGGSTATHTYKSGRWLLLAHPDGRRLGRWTCRRLLVPAGELDEVMRMERVIVVPVDGPTRAEVLLPAHRALARRGVPISATLVSQVSGARTARP